MENKPKNHVPSRITKRMEELTTKISAALMQQDTARVAELNRAIGDFEERVQRILERTPELDKIQEILNDKYYFPNIDSIISYMQQAFSKKLAYNKNRRTVAWAAAKIVHSEGGLSKLKEDVLALRRIPSHKETTPVNLYALTSKAIKEELSNILKYPDSIALKKVLRGVLSSKKLSDLHSRDGLIEAAIEAIERKRSVSVFSKGGTGETSGPDDNRP